MFQKWEYMNIPKENSPEEKLMKVLKEPVDWLRTNTQQQQQQQQRAAA